MNEVIEIGCIRTDGGTQSRAAIDSATVDAYADSYADGASIPPVVVYFDGDDYWLADGFHRVRAAEQAELAEIDADVRQGTRRDAVLHSVGANASHGLRRTRADKRRAVEVLLRDVEWSTWSDRAIAEACNVSNTFVSNLRTAATVNVDSGPQANADSSPAHAEQEDLRTGRDGRTIDVAGLRRGPPDVDSGPPAAGPASPSNSWDPLPPPARKPGPPAADDPWVRDPVAPAVEPAAVLVTDPAILRASLAALAVADPAAVSGVLAELPKKVLRAAGRTERKKNDVYYTPNALADEIVLQLDGDDRRLAGLRVLEPSAGGAAFAAAADLCGAEVTVVDVAPDAACLTAEAWKGRAHLADFLEWRPDVAGVGFDLIVGNPPYIEAEAFVRHASELLAPGGLCVFLLRLGFWAGLDRCDGFYREHPVEDVRPVAPRPSFTGDGKTDGSEYGVFYFRKPAVSAEQVRLAVPETFGRHVRWTPADSLEVAAVDELEAA